MRPSAAWRRDGVKTRARGSTDVMARSMASAVIAGLPVADLSAVNLPTATGATTPGEHRDASYATNLRLRQAAKRNHELLRRTPTKTDREAETRMLSPPAAAPAGPSSAG